MHSMKRAYEALLKEYLQAFPVVKKQWGQKRLISPIHSANLY